MITRYVKLVNGEVKFSCEGYTEAECQKIEVSEEDVGLSGSRDWWVIDGDAIRKPTAAELTARAEVAAAAALVAAYSALYTSCLAYQVAQVDQNMNNEIAASRAAVIAGKATAEDLPLAAESGAWVEALWAEYYARKVDALNASLGFSDMGAAPNDFAVIRSERETFLAGA